jgi:uncharacterized protein (AIM24 family)
VPVPNLRLPNLTDETFDGVTYHVRGELGPVLVVDVDSTPVFFEHQILLWKDSDLGVRPKKLAGEFRRSASGSPIVVVETVGAGHVGLSREATGRAYALHLHREEAIEVHEHQWIAATGGTELTFRHVQGFTNMDFSDTGYYIDTFTCRSDEGIVWVHGNGDVFEVDLQVGERIDIEPSAWIYRSKGLRPEPIVQQFPMGFFAGSGQLILDRFTGPGRVGFQSNAPAPEH